MIDLIFNDLSLQPYAGNLHETRHRMSVVMQFLAEAPKYRLGKMLRTPENFYSLELEPGYQIVHWVHDKNVDQAEHGVFLKLATTSPFLSDAGESVILRAGEVEIRIDAKESAALTAAYLLDLPTVSLYHDKWREPHLISECNTLEFDGDVFTSNVQITNFSHDSHFVFHSNWLTEKLQRTVTNGEKLWADRESLFTKLIFCRKTHAQISVLDSSNANFAQIVSLLSELESYCNKWKDGGFDRYFFSVACDPSSKATLEKFGNEYFFTSPNESRFLCHWHLRLPVNSWRIYFYPDCESRSIVVGHIGPHLPTVKFS